MEAIVSATKLGGEIMMQGDELGQIKDGFLADLLLVDGDPLANLSILRDRSKLLAVMKDGTFYKQPEMALGPLTAGQSAAAAPDIQPGLVLGVLLVWRSFGLPLVVFAVWGIVDNERLFFATG